MVFTFGKFELLYNLMKGFVFAISPQKIYPSNRNWLFNRACHHSTDFQGLVCATVFKTYISNKFEVETE